MPEDYRRIQSPERCGRLASAIILISSILYAGTLYYILDPSQAVRIYTCSYGLLLVLALLFRDPMAVHITLLALLSALWSWSRIWPPFWPFSPFVPLVIYAIAVTAIPSLRRSVTWLRVGETNRSVWFLILVTILTSSSGLLLWFLQVKPDLSRFLGAIPTWHPILLIPVGLGFSVVNAALEEFIYRGVLMQALDAALGPGKMALIVQAVVFGSAHFKGVPDGWIGVGMATVYGLMLGVIRRRGQGLFAPFVAHVCADVVIFCMLAFWMR